jgi:protocatechuate 3,4-dioxygenase alpha subunit
VGPFFNFALPFEGGAEVADLAGPLIRLEGQLLDGEGQPVPDGLVEAWEGDLFARCGTDAEGVFNFVLPKPAPQPGQAPHLNLTIHARGLLRHLMTRVYFPDEEAANAGDRVLQKVPPERRPTLVARRDGEILRFDVRLQGEEETVFFDSEPV